MGQGGDTKVQDEPAGGESSPETPADALKEHLRRVIVDAEAELQRLKRCPQAWREVRAYLTDTMPHFGSGPIAQIRLGPRAPKNTKGIIATRALSSLRAMERAVRECRRCREMIKRVHDREGGHAIVAQARTHHKAAFRRYAAEFVKPFTVLLEMPAWSAAQRAATAAAALEHVESPMACFAAGAYLEQQRLLAWTARTLVSSVGARTRRRLEEGIKRGRSPSLERVVVGRARANAAKAYHRKRQAEVQPIRVEIVKEYDRLRAAGLGATAAVRTIATDPDIRTRVRAIAKREGVRSPWRGEFYSFSGIRRIVGL